MCDLTGSAQIFTFHLRHKYFQVRDNFITLYISEANVYIAAVMSIIVLQKSIGCVWIIVSCGITAFLN